MEKKSKKNLIIGITSLFLVTLVLLGLTYAYYRTRIIGNNSNEPSISVTSKELEIVYSDNDSRIKADKIEPSFSATKTFTVSNDSDGAANYIVYLEDVVNTFIRRDDIKIKVDCSSNKGTCNGYSLNNYPSHNILIAKNVINVGEVQTYTLSLEYLNDVNIDQSDDMGKSLSGKINIYDTRLESTDNLEYLSGVTVSGLIADNDELSLDGLKVFSTFNEAHAAVKEMFKTPADGIVDTASYNVTLPSEITYTIYGGVDWDNTAMNRALTGDITVIIDTTGKTSALKTINIVGGNESAEIIAPMTLSNFDGQSLFRLPEYYDGGMVAQNVNISNIAFNEHVIITPFYKNNLTIENCEFTGALYVRSFGNKNIQGNTFIYDTEKFADDAFAITLSDVVSITSSNNWSDGKLTAHILDNTIKNYPRGVNLDQNGDKNYTGAFTAKVVNNNTFENISAPNRTAIQLTNGQSFEIVGNTFTSIAGNVLLFYPGYKNTYKVLKINNNIINSATYLAQLGEYTGSTESSMETMGITLTESYGNDISGVAKPGFGMSKQEVEMSNDFTLNTTSN